jgi:hypothetical protein
MLLFKYKDTDEFRSLEGKLADEGKAETRIADCAASIAGMQIIWDH